MGEVVATIKVMPISPETDLEQLKADIEANIPNDAEFHKIDEEPIAFGLVALNTMVIVDDGEGGTESTEAALDNLENVESIQVTDVRRLM
jgi:elongation factor 1-beta